MTTPLCAPAGQRYLEVASSFKESAFRLEARQNYAGSGEDVALQAFRDGRPQPPLDDDDREYLRRVTEARGRGASWRRVHVVRQPLSEYLRFELTWEYGPNVAAGEEIGIVALSAGDSWPADLPGIDFWLFDSSTLFELHYDDDDTWLGIEEVRDPRRIGDACEWRDAALRRAQDWGDYLAAHPELVARVPAMREAS